MVEKTPEPAWARGRGTKRKAAAGKQGKSGGGGKSRKTGKGDGDREEKMPAMNPAKIMEAHPVCVLVLCVMCVCVTWTWHQSIDGVARLAYLRAILTEPPILFVVGQPPLNNTGAD